MNPAETTSLIGHVRNGVIVLDDKVSLNEGEAVRIEPLGLDTWTPLDTERADRVGQLQRLFAEWTEEDGKLSDDEADRLRTALEQSGRLEFRTPTVD